MCNWLKDYRESKPAKLKPWNGQKSAWESHRKEDYTTYVRLADFCLNPFTFASLRKHPFPRSPCLRRWDVSRRETTFLRAIRPQRRRARRNGCFRRLHIRMLQKQSFLYTIRILIQSNPVNMDTERGIKGARIKRASVKRGLTVFERTQQCRAQLFEGRLALNPGLNLTRVFSDNFLTKRIKTEMLFKLSNLDPVVRRPISA